MEAGGIKNVELIRAYMKHERKTYVTNRAGDLTPLLPFFVLDVAYQIYQREVLPLQCTQNAQRWKKEWGRVYGLLNRSFFAAFDDDQRDAIIDRMDDLSEYVSGAVDNVLEKVRAFLRTNTPEEKIPVVASCLVCNVLAQTAAIAWEQIYTDRKGRPMKNPYIERVASASSNFLNSYSRPQGRIRCNDDKEVDDSATKLQARIIGWLKETADR